MSLKKLPRLLKIVAAVTGSFVVLLVAVVIAVRSPWVTSRILPPLQKKLAQDFHLKTKISGLSIDPFARVALEGVQAEWTKPELGVVAIDLESVLIRFSFWELLKRNLQVSEIEVLSPRLKAEIVLSESSEKKAPSNPLPLLRQLIVNPPAMIHLDSLSVKNLSIDALIRQGRMTSRARIQDINFSSSVMLENKSLMTGLKFRMGLAESGPNSKSRVLLEARNASPALPFLRIEGRTAVDFSTDLNFSFQDSDKPFFELSNTNTSVNAERFLLNTKLEKGGAADLILDELKASKILLNAVRFDLAKIFELESLPGDQFEKQVPEKILALIKDFTGSAESTVRVNGLSTSLKIPAAGIDTNIDADFEIPMRAELTPEEYQISTGGAAFVIKLRRIALRGSAFEDLLKNMRIDHLTGLGVRVPFKLRLTRPSLKNLNKPLDGIRINELGMEPALNWTPDREDLLTAKIDVNQKITGEFNVNVRSDLSLRERLFKLVPALKVVNENLGQLRVKSDLKGQLLTQWKDLQTAIDSALTGVRNISLDYKIILDQVAMPPQKSPTGLNLAGGIQIVGRAELPQPATLKDIKVSTDVDWSGSPVLKNRLSISNAIKKLSVSGESEIFALLRLRKMTPLASQLGMLGGTRISATWKVSLPHNADTILKAQWPPPQLMNADAEAETQIQFVEKPVLPLFEQNTLQISGPLRAKVQSSLRQGTASVKLNYQIPKVGLPAFALVETLAGQLTAQTKMDLSGGVELGVKADIGGITPSKSLGLPEDVIPYLNNIAAQLNVQTDVKSRVDIRQGNVSTGKDKFKLSFRGGSDLKATNSRFEGQLAVKPPKLFRYGIRAQDKIALDGVVQVGWELTQKEQKALRLRGDASLENFSAQHQLGGIKNASGRVPFQQDLELPNFKSLKWSYLIQDNPFKRVDASKFVPLLSDDSFLVIEELNALEKKFGPLRGRFSLTQNMLTIDRLDADIFEGVLAGQGFVDIQPSRLLAGLQGRVTKLNTAKLSAKPETAPAAPLSARLAMVVDLSKALIEGRVDVTEIGKNQLLAMTDLLDPSGADPLLNKARLALGVGYPTYVGLQMQQGFLDLDIGLGGLVTQQFKISHLPLTPIINAKTQDLVKTLREVPIQ